MDNRIDIAIYQMEIFWENKEKNFQKVEEKLSELKEEIDLFLLPEMSFTGFSMDTDKTKENDMYSVNRVRAIAKEHKIAIGFGWVKDCGAKSENHYTIVDKDGEILTDYAKIHPFSYSGEDIKFQGGNEIVTFDMNGIRCSVFICYDLRFPEIFQHASKSADIIIVPANWPAKRQDHWECLLKARAIENQVYIVAINCVNSIGGVEYNGGSCVIDPNGDIKLLIDKQEKISFFSMINDVDEFRKAFPTKRDRREEIYRG